jgi:hypothetical protein
LAESRSVGEHCSDVKPVDLAKLQQDIGHGMAKRGRRPGESNHRGGALSVCLSVVPVYGKVSFQLLM